MKKKTIKNGKRFYPNMKCICGNIGCYDYTTQIVCEKCYIPPNYTIITTKGTMVSTIHERSQDNE